MSEQSSMKAYKLMDWLSPATWPLQPGQTIDHVWDKLVNHCKNIAMRARPDLPWGDETFLVIVRFGEADGKAWVCGQLAIAAESKSAPPSLASGSEVDYRPHATQSKETP